MAVAAVRVAIGILTNAAMTWLMYFADDGALREFMFWMMGSLAYGSQQLPGGWLVLPSPSAGSAGRGGTATTAAGETQARLMGLNVDSMRVRLVLAVCLLTGGGLPVRRHRLRRPGGASPAAPVRWQRSGLPAARLGAGGGARCSGPIWGSPALHAGELPIGVITASVGAPPLSICC